MVTTERPPLFIHPTYSCLFEQAESFIETLFPGKSRFKTDMVTQAIVDTQLDACHITVEALQEALALKTLQRRVRLGRLLQGELVKAFDNLCVKRQKASKTEVLF